MTLTPAYTDLPTLAGTEIGPSSWMEITQERVQTFADATDDQQWIHVDPVRAADGPFGGAIAHGFLTLSLLLALQAEVFDVAGVGTKVNYGLDRVRFVSPVKVGARIRLVGTIAEVTEVAGGYQLVVDATIEIEGGAKPALVARSLQRFYA